MGGKTGTTTSQVSIPPDVLARYNAVNAQAQQVAATPFQPYTGQFVAGLTPTQQAGIQATSQYAQTAQPYYQAATGQLMSAQQSALPGISAAYQNVGEAQNVGQQYGQTAGEYYGGAAGAAMPYYGAMQQGIGGALSYAQPLNTAAQQAATSATGAATPYYQAATQGTAEAVAAAQPYQEAARQGLGAALQYSGGINQMAPQLAYSAYGATQPIMGQALSGTQAAQQAGAPYQRASTQAALAGAQGISPEALNIGAYMSPYTQSVADTTYQALRQQQQQEMAGQTANAIRSGAFGGDRAALAAANLARQQQLGTAQALAPIYQQGYGQALAAAQQQQGVGLSAAQANRAAMQNLAAQLQGIGQQGYAQQLGAAGQIGQLGQNIYGQGLGTAQALSQMGQTGFGQQLQAAQAQAALGQQAYGQQLGAAQQFGNLGQNIYGMGANQANLLSQLGQTGYGQQLGAAQQYGNIGQNLYTMGLGTGQALQGLGQQQYGQGMGAAQQLAGLAQQGYGMGAATSQALAGLGTQAQQAGLQGAQAQMGAGTLEQQTQQADLTARYQQFLQERGYPFQVAQFLANIAMGTGALSGSTTTTTQPMPFFSDRRVKDDVKEIGKTHDGQPIYSFKYKGDNSTQIGLMAQDVEKKHPEAVGEYGGIKTVDYKEATKDAERSERYAGGLVPESQGGAVTAPGAYGRGGYQVGGFATDPNDIQALLQQQQQAFGPFGESGVYGGTQHQSPYASGKGIVPQTRLHTPRLIQAGAPPKLPESGAQQALNAWDAVKDARGRIQEARDMINKFTKGTPQEEEDKSRIGQTGTTRSNLAGPDIVPDKAKEEPGWLEWAGQKLGFMADGGVVPRQHYAVGGSKDPSLPYEEDDKSPYKYFPTEILEADKPELAKANTPSGGTSQTGIGIGDVAKIISMLPFGAKDGGVVPRSGYQEGGSPDLDRYLDAIAQIESSRNPRAIGPETKKGDRAYGLYQVMGSNIPSWSEEALGRRMTPQEFLADEDAQRAVARHHFGKALNQYGTPEDAASVWFSGRPMAKAGNATDILGTTVPEYINRFRAAADLPAAGAATAQGVRPPADIPNTPQGIKPAETDNKNMMQNAQDWLAQNQGWLSPLGAGLKGMVQSKSPFLGGALLEGVGSGLEAVSPSQQAIAQQKLTGATTGLTQAETTTKSLHFIPGIGGFMWVLDPSTGSRILIPYSVYSKNPGQYKEAFGPPPSQKEASVAAQQFGGAESVTAPKLPTPSVPGTTPSGTEPPKVPSTTEAKPSAPSGTNFDDKSVEAAKAAVQATQDAQSTMMPGIATQPIEEGNLYRKGVVGLAQSTRENFGNTIDYIKNITDAVEMKGFNETGTQSQLRENVVRAFGTLARAFGADADLNLADVGDINRKMQALRSQMMAQGAGQESFRALELMSNAMVNNDMSEDTMAKLGAITLMLEGRAMDRLDHADKWGNVSGSNYYQAGKDFERVNPTNQFEKEVEAVKWMIKNAAPITKDLFKSDPKEIDDMFMAKFGLPNMSRYFRAR